MTHTLILANQIPICFFTNAEKGKKLNTHHEMGGVAVFWSTDKIISSEYIILV